MDDQELCVGLAAGRPEAFDDLVATHGSWMLRLAYAIVGTTEASEDVVYTLIAKWWADPPTIDPIGFRGYVRRCIYHSGIDRLRRDLRETGQPPRPGDDGMEPDKRRKPMVPPVAGESEAERYEVLREALPSLRPRDLEVLEMNRGRPLMPAEDAAAELGLTLGAYKKAVHDAKMRLQAAMQSVREARRARQGNAVN